MRKLVLLLWLTCVSAVAQTHDHLTISFTATPNAVTAAGGIANLATQLTNAVNGMNTSLNGGNPTWGQPSLSVSVPNYPTRTAPDDNRSLNDQFKWVQSSVEATKRRDQSEGDVAIHIFKPTTDAGGVYSPLPPTSAGDAVAAIPYNNTNMALNIETAIARALGSDPTKGTQVRERQYDYSNFADANIAPPEGRYVCYHTKETTAKSASATTPRLDYWTLSGVDATAPGYVRAQTKAQSCNGYLAYARVYYATPTAPYTNLIDDEAADTAHGFPAGSCKIFATTSSYPSTPAYTVGYSHIDPSPASAPITTCTETLLNQYSDANQGVMKAAYNTVKDYHNKTKQLLRRAEYAAMNAIQRFLADYR